MCSKTSCKTDLDLTVTFKKYTIKLSVKTETVFTGFCFLCENTGLREKGNEKFKEWPHQCLIQSGKSLKKSYFSKPSKS